MTGFVVQGHKYNKSLAEKIDAQTHFAIKTFEKKKLVVKNAKSTIDWIWI